MPAPLIVGHRGAAHDAPENTIASFRLAWQQHADAIEGDFRLSKDGIVVCTHDETFQRCANLDQKVADLTLAQIRRIDVGSWKDPKFKGERVPTLAEVLATVPSGKQLFIEAKSGPEMVPTLLEAIATAGVSIEQLRLIAFDADLIAASKKARPELKAFWLTSFKAKDGQTTKRPTIDECLATLARTHADGLDAQADPAVIDRAFVKSIRAAGKELHVWTVDDPAIARRFASLGVYSLTTNRLGFLRAALESL